MGMLARHVCATGLRLLVRSHRLGLPVQEVVVESVRLKMVSPFPLSCTCGTFGHGGIGASAVMGFLVQLISVTDKGSCLRVLGVDIGSWWFGGSLLVWSIDTCTVAVFVCKVQECKVEKEIVWCPEIRIGIE